MHKLYYCAHVIAQALSVSDAHHQIKFNQISLFEVQDNWDWVVHFPKAVFKNAFPLL